VGDRGHEGVLGLARVQARVLDDDGKGSTGP
jgi:hypothetical protein